MVILPTDDREARRRRFVAMLLRAELGTGFLDADEVASIRRAQVDRAAGVLVLILFTGSRIIDRGDALELRAQVPTQEDIQVLVDHVLRLGWQSVELDGTAEFRAAAGTALRAAGVTVDGIPGVAVGLPGVEEDRAMEVEPG